MSRVVVHRLIDRLVDGVDLGEWGSLQLYLFPLRQYCNSEEGRRTLSLQVLDAIFLNIEQIYNIHRSMLAELHGRLARFPFVSDIPSLILRMVGSFAVYNRYSEQAANADETLRFYKQKPPFNTFIPKVSITLSTTFPSFGPDLGLHSDPVVAVVDDRGGKKVQDDRQQLTNMPARVCKVPSLQTLLNMPHRHLIDLFQAVRVRATSLSLLSFLSSFFFLCPF